MLPDFLDHVKSFALARVIMTAIELDIFRQLEKAPRSRAELKQRLSIADTPIADATFDILVAFSILAEENGKLTLLPLSQSVLPVYDSIQSWNKEMELFYSSLNDFTTVLKSGCYQDTELSDYWVYKNSQDHKEPQLFSVNDYSYVMDASQAQLSQTIVEHYDFSVHDHIIDFGGGYGRLAITLAKRNPHLRITIADLPSVCDGARARVAAAGLGGRIECLPVDFFHDELPTSFADAILFVRVLHDWSYDEVENLISRTRFCLRRHGVVLVVEPMTDEASDINPSSALSSLMVTLFGGKRRSVQEHIRILHSAGYQVLSWNDLGLSLYKMVVAQV